MIYRLILEKRAVGFLAKQSGRLAEQLAAHCDALQHDPYPPGCRRLRGNIGPLYRIRFGDYRIVYDVDDVGRTVRIVAIGHRSRIYD